MGGVLKGPSMELVDHYTDVGGTLGCDGSFGTSVIFWGDLSQKLNLL